MRCGKIIHDSKGDALSSAKGLYKGKGRCKTASVYFCDDCQGWHTASGGLRLKTRKKRSSKNFMDTPEMNTKQKRDYQSAKSSKNEWYRIRNIGK